jgi:hypothetical protein
MKNFPRPRPEPTSEKFLVVCDICGPWSTRHTTAEHLVAHRSPRRRAPATWGPCSTHDDLCPRVPAWPREVQEHARMAENYGG